MMVKGFRGNTWLSESRLSRATVRDNYHQGALAELLAHVLICSEHRFR
jgi:hypothetical protein